MLARQKRIVSLALVFCAAVASASPLVYIVNGAQQFGTVNLATGAFHQIGPDTPEGQAGLVPGPNGSLLSLTYSGKLDSINTATGLTSVIGATGFADCTLPTSPCGPTSVAAFGNFGGAFYATDFANDLYTVNTATGAVTLIGHTGIPALPFSPVSTNPDGSFNFYDENLFGAGGKLYANFDAATFNPVTSVFTTVISPKLYQIDPTTGLATLVASTALGLSTVVNVNGTVYAFQGPPSNQVLTLNLANGNTSFVSNLDPAAGIIGGASPVPEPASIAIAGIGMAAILVSRRLRRARLQKRNI